MHNYAIDCLGVVLAGGLSSRMGKDKSKLTRQSTTHSSHLSTTPVTGKSTSNMLDFSKQLLVDAGIKNIVVSGDNYQIPDLIPHAGPVGGIYSVLASYPEHLQPKAFLILPVDLPLMSASAIAQLRLKGELSNKATFFHDNQKQVHHIPLYLPNNAFLRLFLTQAFKGEKLPLESQANSIGRNKKKNGPSVRGMLQQMPHQAVKSLNNNMLFNTNTPEQWQEAQKHF
jgi:molybdopterin-guanine dinucleotide biosynthesis protein A